MNGKLVTVTCKAFGGRIGTHTCSVDADGTVRVWDSVAQYYTTCHSLSAYAISRIRKLAKTSGIDG